MTRLFAELLKHYPPGPSVVEEAPLTVGTESALTSDPRDELRSTLIENYDPKNRGWGTIQKFLDADIIEYAMNESTGGDGRFERMARETLSAELELMDPAWGGVYQYSTDGAWKTGSIPILRKSCRGRQTTYVFTRMLMRSGTIERSAALRCPRT